MPQRLKDAQGDFDELTGLPTMMYFRRYAGGYVRNALEHGRVPYLIYFNLENFSTFNERYGFEEGDKLLELMSRALQEAFPGFLLSRFASDHFLLVCECLDLERAIEDVGQQLRTFGKHGNIELKAGVVWMEDADIDISMACDRAKLACDSIAHRHDLNIRVFDDALNWKIERAHYIESHIDNAIEKHWIKVYFQPIVRTVTGEVCDFEALARWEDPRYGMLSPGVFIEVLEECHLIHKLDAYVVERACEIWRSLRNVTSRFVPFSVNLSRLDFEHCDVYEMVDSAARTYGVPPQMIHVEITESALTEDKGMLLRDIDRFRAAGYQVWLDDFGSGYSSLNTLKDYVFDVVKIDMVFLREFEERPQSRVIIASIVNMAKQLGMQTLVEGVETAEQFDFLRSIGCEFAQGYLIGRPVPPQKNLKKISSGEFVVADPSLHGYHDRIGAINVLSPTPFEFPWETSAEGHPPTSLLPLAIIEFESGIARFMIANDAFAFMIREAKMGTMAEIAAQISHPETTCARNMRAAVEAAVASGKLESVDLLENGRHCMMRLRRISSHGNVVALMMSVMSLSASTDLDEEKRSAIALRQLYIVYDEVNVITIYDDGIKNVFRGNASFPSLRMDQSASHSIQQYAQSKIHPDDRQRFVHFLMADSLGERLERNGLKSLSEAFRVLGADGLYLWFTCVVFPIELDGVSCVIVCMRRFNHEVVECVEGLDAIPKSLLWDTLIDLVPAGVFWKNTDRRFMGVNKRFLHFYEFDSVNDVLGKTDEDMGWHVDNDPFKNYELQVIEQGRDMLDTPGQCISRGEVHDILASKVPLRRNGEIIGLLGFFIDKSDTRLHGPMLDETMDSVGTDALTGLINLKGFYSSMLSYREAYEKTGVDFICVAANIHGMRDFNDVYGHSFGNNILRVVAHRLVRSYGTDGVVARIGGDRFAILRQYIDDKAVADFVWQVRRAVEDVSEVDGIGICLRCQLGYSVFSQEGDVDLLFETAKVRMRLD